MARRKPPEGFQDEPVKLIFASDVHFRGAQCVQSRNRRTTSLIMAIDRKVQRKGENLSFTARDARKMAETVLSVLQSVGSPSRTLPNAPTRQDAPVAHPAREAPRGRVGSNEAEAIGEASPAADSGVSDKLVSTAAIDQIRKELYPLGRVEAMKRLESLEPDLHAAITRAAVRAISPLEIMHVGQELVDHVYETAIWGALIAVEAMRRASHDLWRGT